MLVFEGLFAADNVSNGRINKLYNISFSLDAGYVSNYHDAEDSVTIHTKNDGSVLMHFFSAETRTISIIRTTLSQVLASSTTLGDEHTKHGWNDIVEIYGLCLKARAAFLLFKHVLVDQPELNEHLKKPHVTADSRIVVPVVEFLVSYMEQAKLFGINAMRIFNNSLSVIRSERWRMFRLCCSALTRKNQILRHIFLVSG